VLLLGVPKHKAAHLAMPCRRHLPDSVFRDLVTASPADGVVALAAIPPQAVVSGAIDRKLRCRFYRSALRALLFGRDVVSAYPRLFLFAQCLALLVLAGLASVVPAVSVLGLVEAIQRLPLAAGFADLTAV